MFIFFEMMLPITRLSWRLMHMVPDINRSYMGVMGGCLFSHVSDQYLKCFDIFVNFCLAMHRTPTQRSVQPTQIKLKFSQIKQ